MKEMNNFSTVYIDFAMSTYLFWHFYKNKKYPLRKSAALVVLPSVIGEVVIRIIHHFRIQSVFSL